MKRFRLTPLRIALLLLVTVAGSLGVGFATTLPVSSTSLGAGSQTLTKGTCTVSGTSSTTDTYIDAGNATSSFGSTSGMLVQPDAATEKVALVMFSLSGCSLPTTAGADTATLKLTVTGPPSQNRTLTLYPVLQTWNGNVTWNTGHSLQVGGATTTVATGTTNNAAITATVTVDVDAFVKGTSSNFGWEIFDNGSTATGDTTTLATSENSSSSKRPTLTINYEK